MISKYGKHLVTHGHIIGGKETPEYRAWKKIKERCMNINNPRYKDYGGRGICMYDLWIDNFRAFYNYIGPRPSKFYSIERIDNNGNYEPGNIKWATSSEQARNRRTNKLVEFMGRRLTYSELSRECGIPANTLRFRIVNGWDIHTAVSQPVRHKNFGRFK